MQRTRRSAALVRLTNTVPNNRVLSNWSFHSLLAQNKPNTLVCSEVFYRYRELRRSYGFWSELKRAIKDRTEDNKEIKDAFEQLKEDETLTKTKESLEKLTEKSKESVETLKKVVESHTTAGGELLKGGVSKVTDAVQDTWGKVKEKTKVDEAVVDTLEKTMKTIDKTVEFIDKTSESVMSTAEQSAIFKKTQELSQKVAASFTHASKNVPLLGKGNVEGNGDAGDGSPGALVVSRTTDVLQQRLRDATARLRATQLYKNAVRFKERIAESENPAIQKAFEIGDSTAYHLGKMKKQLFSESQTARVFNAIRAYVPQFDPAAFVIQARTQLLPKLRNDLLRCDFQALQPVVHPALLDALRQQQLEEYGPGSVHLSQLLEIDNVEILAAIVDEGGFPILYLKAVTEETLHVQDAEGKDFEGSAEDLIQRVTHEIGLQLNEKGEWVLNSWTEVAHEQQSW